MVWKLSEESSTVMMEEADYPITQFFSDAGGAAGWCKNAWIILHD